MAAKKERDEFGIEGKTAVITGGGGALCGTMAAELARRGAKVAVLDLKLEAAERTAGSIGEAGGAARAYACDVLDRTGLDRIREDLAAVWGEPDFLINGAGGNDPRGTADAEFLEPADLDREGVRTFFDLDPDGFRAVFDLNFFGTVLPTQVFAEGMVRRGSGSIVNISSMSALSPLTKVGAYSAAKAAVANFTRWLAVHFSHAGVRVNALAPGFFMTEQLRFLHVDQATGEYTPRAKKVIAHTPMGRYGDPGDLTGTLLWLLSDASRFVTGTVIPIDGGFSSYSI